jgi:hypothetical protein
VDIIILTTDHIVTTTIIITMQDIPPQDTHHPMVEEGPLLPIMNPVTMSQGENQVIS